MRFIDIIEKKKKGLKLTEEEIKFFIDANAKANGYNLVLAKGAVLSGGTDITDEISKAVK